MGGLPCAKQIIDNGNAVTQQMGCLNATILLAAPTGVQPTYEEAEEFKQVADKLAAVCAAIEKRVRVDSESA